MKPTLLILAAGMGSRYGGLKQIDPVGPNGEYLLDYAVFDAIQAGFGKVVFLITEAIENDFKQDISPRYEGQIELDYAFQALDDLPQGFTLPEERSKPWGTGHAILCAKEVIDEPFAVINADDFYGPTSFKIMANALNQMCESSKEWCMVGFHLENTLSEHGKVSRGVCHTEGGSLSSVVEREKIGQQNGHVCYLDAEDQAHEIPNGSIVSMNFWGFAPHTFFPILNENFIQFLENNRIENELPLKTEFYIPSAVDHTIQTQKASVKVLETPESWFGLTFPEDKQKVQQQILEKVREGVYPDQLFC